MFLAVMEQFHVMEWTKLENDSNTSKIFTEATNFTEAVASFASYIATALPVNSVNVNTPAKKNYVPPLEFGGAKSFFFRDLGGLAPPSPCVEPQLTSGKYRSLTRLFALRQVIGLLIISTLQSSHFAIDNLLYNNPRALTEAQVKCWSRSEDDSFFHSFIHSGHIYSASSSPLLFRGDPDTARILCRSFAPRRHKQLRVKDLPKVPTWLLERDSNPRPSGRQLSTLPTNQ